MIWEIQIWADSTFLTGWGRNNVQTHTKYVNNSNTDEITSDVKAIGLFIAACSINAATDCQPGERRDKEGEKKVFTWAKISPVRESDSYLYKARTSSLHTMEYFLSQEITHILVVKRNVADDDKAFDFSVVWHYVALWELSEPVFWGGETKFRISWSLMIWFLTLFFTPMSFIPNVFANSSKVIFLFTHHSHMFNIRQTWHE